MYDKNQVFKFDKLFQSYLKKKGVKVSKQFLNQNLVSHPFYPSFLSFAALLDSIEIAHAAIKINIEDLSKVTFPVLAHKNDKPGDFYIINGFDGQKVQVEYATGQKYLTIDEFQDNFSGHILIAESKEKFKEAGYIRNKIIHILLSIRLPLLIFTILLSIYFLNITSGIKFFYILFFLNSIGLIASFLLVQKALIGNIGLLNKVCSFNEKTNCDKVLNSNSSKLFGLISWTDIGVVYFLTCLSSIVLSFSMEMLKLVQVISFIVFSIHILFYLFSVESYKTVVYTMFGRAIDPFIRISFFVYFLT